ncbi:MAG TPA: F0F1 ATP synthase subunit A [Candidatus Acidoferrum sp.]|jgi:F-type H+-transporting ATPase subunit a
MEHASALTELVNRYLGGLALALLSALHLKPSNPKLPIPEHVVMAFVVLVVATLLALWVKSRLSVERPGASQQIAEFLLNNPMGFGIRDVLSQNAGHEWERYVPVVGSIGLFVLLGNLFGAFPFLTAPTAVYAVPLACAILAFSYFNWQGIRHHGPIGYMKHFIGPVPWLAWLIFPVEILSTTARLLSLSVRLWANIFASDIIYGLFVGLFASAFTAGWTKSPVLGIIAGILPALFPIAFLLLHIFVSVVQAYVFTILPSVYIGMSTEEHL